MPLHGEMSSRTALANALRVAFAGANPSPLAVECLKEMDGAGTSLVLVETQPTSRGLVDRLHKRVLELHSLEQGPLLESEFPTAADLDTGPAQLIYLGGVRRDFQVVVADGRLLGMIGYPAGGFVSPAVGPC